VESAALDVQLLKLGRRDLFADRIATAVEASADDQAAEIGSATDQVDDRFVRAERSASPVARNEREKPVFDLVPLSAVMNSSRALG
jgi:hypothetical protein